MVVLAHLGWSAESIFRRGATMRYPRIARLAIIFILSLQYIPSSAAGVKHRDEELTDADQKAIKATIEAYRTAWLTNDSKGVLATFTDDAVLQPAHGSPAIVGITPIEKYWFT